MAANQPGPGSGSSSSSGLQQHLIYSPFGVGDTTFTKVFVGGLAWETQSETLRRHFEQFGDILEAVVITDKHTGRSKGYGFVSFLIPFFFLSFGFICIHIFATYIFSECWKSLVL